MIYDYDLFVLDFTKVLISLGNKFVYLLYVIRYVGSVAHHYIVNEKVFVMSIQNVTGEEDICVVIPISNINEKFPRRAVMPTENMG